MCDCVYCQGDKPWSGDPDEWPHTPPVHVFLALQDKDPNLWWRMSSGHGQNIAEEAIDLCEELTNENKSIKSTLTDLIAELRDRHADCTTCYTKRALDRAEVRLREVGDG
jgi:hypothetical protein